jgi:YbbR domain-containing protein
MLDTARQLLTLTWDSLAAAGNSVRSNWGLALFSLALAFGLWLLVVEGENPSRTGFFPAAIPVEPANLPPGLALAAPIDAVTIRITAPEDTWGRLSIDDFRALADLSRVTPGENRAPVIGQSLRDDVRVDSVVPDRTVIQIGTLVNLPVPVLVNLVGAPAQGYEVGTAIVNPQQVTVSGAEELANRVEVAAADVNIFGAIENVKRSIKLTPRDSRGLIVEGVSFDPDIAEIEVPIERRLLTSSYAVRPSIIGVPAPGYNVTNVSIDPTTITLVGPQEALEQIQSVSTADLNIGGATGDISQRVSLSLPSNVNVVGTNGVTLSVRIEPAIGEAVFGVAPHWQGVGPGLSVSPVVPVVEVKLGGPLPQLKAISSDQIAVSINLSGLTQGVHRIRPDVQAPDGLSIVNVSPAMLEVEIVSSP